MPYSPDWRRTSGALAAAVLAGCATAPDPNAEIAAELTEANRTLREIRQELQRPSLTEWA